MEKSLDFHGGKKTLRRRAIVNYGIAFLKSEWCFFVKNSHFSFILKRRRLFKWLGEGKRGAWIEIVKYDIKPINDNNTACILYDIICTMRIVEKCFLA